MKTTLTKTKILSMTAKSSAEEHQTAIEALTLELARLMNTSNALVATINFGDLTNSTILMEELQHVREIGRHMSIALENLTLVKPK